MEKITFGNLNSNTLFNPLVIGKVGEKGNEITIDTSFIGDRSGGDYELVVMRNGDNNGYIADSRVDDDGNLVWEVSEKDCDKYGLGFFQVVYSIGEDVVIKSDVFTFSVENSIEVNGNNDENP